MTDPHLSYASLAGDGEPARNRPPSGLAAHTIAFNLFVVAILAAVVWWMRLRDDELIRMRREIDGLRAAATATTAGGHDGP
jgi:hypothetical protein